MKKVKPNRKAQSTLSTANLEAHNRRLQGHYAEYKEFFGKMATMLEATPDEHTLSNKQVAEYLRDWLDDMDHIIDFLEEDILRAQAAKKELEFMKALLK